MSSGTLAVICARGGSRGVPGKNSWRLGNTPLITRAVTTAREAGVFDLIATSSDAPDLLRLAGQAGADLLIERPSTLASDTASKLDAIRHAVEAAERAAGDRFDIVVDLDVTTPLRTPQDIVDTLQVLADPSVDRVFTASPARRSPYFNQVELDERGVPALPCGDGTIVRRQDAPEVFDLSGAVYAWRREALFAPGPLVQTGARLHLIPPERAWDIDSELDLILVEAMAEREAGR